MKNLKKVLALGLALVMVLGMFTMVSAADEETETTSLVASDLADWDEVENKAAVALNVDLEIVKGRLDGNFGAADPIRRDEWAKMVYVAMVGDDDASIYVGEGAAYTDMESNWAKGYVNYLSDLNVVSGFAGLYSPEANITVVQAAKTMLTALGYDADKEGYVNNDNWAIRVMAKAKELGLLAGVDQKQDEKITKDNAAQMVYNCLFCQTVTPEYDRDMGEWYVKSYNPGETLGYEVFNLIEVSAVVTGLNADGTAILDDIYAVGGDVKVTGANLTAVNGKLAASAEEIGQNVVFFVKGTITRNDDGKATAVKVSSIISNAMVAAGSDILLDTYAAVTIANVYDDTKDDYVADFEDKVTVYTNGVKTVSAKAQIPNNTVGNRMQLIDNAGDGVVDTVKITTYRAAQVTGDVKVATKKSDGKDYVTIPGVLAETKASLVVGYEDLEKYDVVLVNTDKSTIVTIEKAEIVSGKVTRVASAGKITVNGTAYAASSVTDSAVATAHLAAWADRDNEYEFALDKAGRICWSTKVTDESTSDEVVALLIAKGKTGASDAIGAAAAKFQAQVIYTDGTIEVLEPVAKFDGVAPTWTSADLTNAPVLVTVKEGDDGYELTTRYAGTTNINGKDITAAPKFDAANTATNSTVFFTYDTTKKAWTVKTGYKNVPSMASASGWIWEDTNTTTKLGQFVFLSNDGTAADVTADATDYVFVTSTAYVIDEDAVYLYTVIDVDGNEIDLKVKDANAFVGGSAVALFKVSQVNDKGVATKLEKATMETNTVEVKDDDIMVIGSKTVTIDSATKCLVIDLDEEGKFDSASTFDPADLDVTTSGEDAVYKGVKGFVVGTDNKTADLVVVVRTAAPAES